jgi:hypothetical protein
MHIKSVDKRQIRRYRQRWKNNNKMNWTQVTHNWSFKSPNISSGCIWSGELLTYCATIRFSKRPLLYEVNGWLGLQTGVWKHMGCTYCA